MSHEPDEQELLELVHALQSALWRCYAWRDAPAYVAGIALTAINDSDDVLSGYDFDDDDQSCWPHHRTNR